MRAAGKLASSPSAITPSQREIASYSRDMLEQLKGMAARHRLYRLAELLEAATLEANRVCEEGRLTRNSRK